MRRWNPVNESFHTVCWICEINRENGVIIANIRAEQKRLKLVQREFQAG